MRQESSPTLQNTCELHHSNTTKQKRLSVENAYIKKTFKNETKNSWSHTEREEVVVVLVGEGVENMVGFHCTKIR